MHTQHPIPNLIKYDLKFVYKQVIVFYIIVIVLAVTARLTNFDNSPFFIKFIHEFAQGASFGFSLGMIINASLRTWAKFKYSMFGDESYLSHTLPIKRSTLWNAKFLSSLIVIILSVAVFIICLLIMFLSPETIDLLRSFSSSFWTTLALFALTLLNQFMFIMQCGITGIVLGHRHSNNPMAHSVLYGILIYLGVGFLLFGLCLLWSLFNPTLRTLLIDGTFQDLSDANGVLAYVAMSYLIVVAISYFVNRTLLQRGVNVD